MPNYNSLFSILGQIQHNSPDPVEEYIRSFSELPEGWNFGEGRAPSREVINKAIEVYGCGKSFMLTGNAFPLEDGEIEISFSNQDHFIDILITSQSTLEYTYEIGKGDEYNEIEHIENISFNEIDSKLKELEKMKPCDSLEYSMHNGTSIMVREDFKVVVLGKSVQAFPSLTEIVWPRITIPQYAAT